MSFTIGGGVNLEKCYTNLLSADVNNDGYISQSEFLSYIQTSAPNGILSTNQYGVPISTFSDLPQSFIGVYNFFACGDALVGCPSVIGIDIGGLLTKENEGMELSGQETTFIYQLCKDTEEVVEEFESSLVTTAPTTTTTTTANNKPTNEPTKVVTSVPTVSPTRRNTLSPITSAPTIATTTTTPSCPPQYTTGQTYQEGDLVSNPIQGDSSSSGGNSMIIPYFKCRPFPFTAWCSQAAYEPGVTMAWEQAWELMGVCDNGSGNGGDGSSTTTSSTIAATTPAATEITTVQTTTTDATVATSIATITTTPAVPTPTTTPATPTITPNLPTRQPTTITIPPEGEETPTSGPLPVQFQYEIGNNQNMQSQSILTQSDPMNDMLDYLESGTDSFVKLIMDATFGGSSSSSSSSSAVSAAQKEASSKRNDNDENIRKTKRTRRHLVVTYNTTSVSIETISDIACSYPNMTSESRCQKVTAGVTLELRNEPPLMTKLRFQTGISRGIQSGMLIFPPESGIVYVGETNSKAVQVIPELGGGKSPGNGGGGGENSNDSSTNDKWVVPVSVTVAAVIAVILILFAGTRFRKRQREQKELDDGEAVDQVSLEGGGGNDLENDLSPNYYSYPPRSKRHMNIFEETIEDTPQIKEDDDSDLIDLEQGETVTMTMKPSDEHRTNPFSHSSSSSSASSSGSDSYDMSPQPMRQHQSISKGFPLPSWKEVSEDDLSKSGEMGELYMKERDSNDYRAGVEALVRQACPEHIDSVDDMMAEYEGRETVLIGQLSVMLAAQRQKETDEGGGDSFAAVQRSGAVLRDSRSYDESSAAGSSQWSTDDGMSSIDASMSASSSEKELPDTYAVIGDAAMTITDSNLRTTTFIKVDKNPDDEFSGLDLSVEGKEKSREKVITRDDLDAAIEAGDWTAVGATASLLASKNSFDRKDSQQASIRSESDKSDSVSLSSMDYSDKDRAFELERLIEGGDWKAVMAIASEFEGAGESDSLHASKLSDMEYDQSRLSSSDIFERSTPALTKRQEIEELVRRVVPDEIENIDEMLLQFKGRENELISTLKTMEERSLNSPKSSNSSISSPASSSMASSAESAHETTLKQMPSFQEGVFESDSVLNESDYDTDRKQSSSNSNSLESKTSSSRRSSESKSSSSSEDFSKFVHK